MFFNNSVNVKGFIMGWLCGWSILGCENDMVLIRKVANECLELSCIDVI